MGRRTVNRVGGERPWLDIRSLGRPGPKGYPVFSVEELRQIARTVRGVPEVMVKVTGGGTRMRSVRAHLEYISRDGDLEIETDDGQRIATREGRKELLESWHLDLTRGYHREPRGKARRVKLVHQIVLSMPAPTPPRKVLVATRKFARENFAPQHRYALVLHTDQKHPHVHPVVKAEHNRGQRLHIDKEMLRQWREQFARLMREQGVAANATPRVVRGLNQRRNRDDIFRAQRRGASTALRQRVNSVARELTRTGTIRDSGRPKIIATRKTVMEHWECIAETLEAGGESRLADDFHRFASSTAFGADESGGYYYQIGAAPGTKLRHRTLIVRRAAFKGRRGISVPEPPLISNPGGDPSQTDKGQPAILYGRIAEAYFRM